MSYVVFWVVSRCLEIFSPEKSDGFRFEPAMLGTRGQHANHYTTQAAYQLLLDVGFESELSNLF
jgi:hypothetical protein